MKKNSTNQLFAASGILLLFLGIYFLTYSGFPVSDDEQLFASVSQNIAAGKGSEAPQMYGNNRLLGSFTGSGPLHVYLGAAVVHFLPEGLGRVQGVYLLNPIYTALTAGLIVLIVPLLGFSLKTALVSSLIFGFSTISWPYSQTNFREPLAMLLLGLALLATLSAMQKNQGKKQAAFWWIVSLLSIVGALFTKIILFAVLPGFIFLVFSQQERGAWRKIFTLGIIIFSLTAGLSILAPQNRFSLEFFDRLWDLRRGFPYHQIPRAVLEMLFTPGRGLFFYNPIVVLLPVAWWQSAKIKRSMLIFSILACGGLFLAQATAYGAEWWGITWGARFMLPVLPLIVIGLTPAVEFLLHSSKKVSRGILWGLIWLGALIQLGGVLVSNSEYMLDLFYTQLVSDVGRVLWSFKHAPLLAHWRLLFAGAEVNFASARLFELMPWWVTVVISASLILICISIVCLIVGLQRTRSRKSYWLAAAGLVFGLVGLPALILLGYRSDPRYGANRADIVQMAAVLKSEVEPTDVILVFPYLRTGWYYILNFYQGEADWYSLPNTYPAGDMSSTIKLVDGLTGKYNRVWLVVETASWEPVPTFLESYLPQVSLPEGFTEFEPVEENLQLRLLLYTLDPSLNP